MPVPTTTTSGLPEHAARWVEISEANAYASLADARTDERFSCHKLGSAIALVTPAARSTLIVNRVIGLGVSEAATPDQLDQIQALYQTQRLAWGLELSPVAQPAGLDAWLKQHRLRKGPQTAMLLRRCEPLPTVDCALTIRLWQEKDGDQAAQLASTLFAVPELLTQRLIALARHPRWRQWVACDGERIVATSLLYLGPETPDALGHGIAWCGWGATLPSHRGMGLHAALLAARLRDAAAHGCTWLSSETALGTPEQPDQSHRNLLRMGFQQVAVRQTYVGVPGRAIRVE